MSTLADQQRLEAEKARFENEYRATIAERRRVALALNDPTLTESQRTALNVQYLQLDNRAVQLDNSAVSVTNELNRVTNQINQGPNPPIAGGLAAGQSVPNFANQNTGGNSSTTAGRYQQAVADDQIRINTANQQLADTNQQLADAERRRIELTQQLRNNPEGSPAYEEARQERAALSRRQAELETQQSALQDDIRVRENSLSTNINQLSLMTTGTSAPTIPPPSSTLVADTTGVTSRLPSETGSQTSPAISQSIGTVPPDDPQAGEFEARQRLLDQQPVFAPTPVSDDNLAFEPISDDNLAFANAPTVPRDDPQAGEFEAGQFQIAQELRSEPQAVTVIDPETGLPVETLASVEARQQFAAQETGISPYGEQDDPREFPADTDTTVDDTRGYIVPDGTINVPPDGQLLREPTALGGDYSAQFDPETQTWGVYDNETGEFIQTGLTEQQATLDAEEYSVGDPNFAGNTDGTGDTGVSTVPISDDNLAFEQETEIDVAGLERARVQAVLEDQQRQADSGDWRFKIRLAPGARYLYRGENGQGVRTGILAPLAVTDGVVFPYTPSVTTAYLAKYNEQELPHSNYKGYFYGGSSLEGITVEGKFTAQDTEEANYLLAVIHFFRSVTKMFYGQNDSFRGAPPPLVFLQGFGAYQFSRHPCVVTRFNYRLPDDVDYIRADVQPISGLSIQQSRRPDGVPPQSVPTDIFAGAMARLSSAGIPKGAINIPPPADTLGTRSPTYVPTLMQITLELLPMQTRQQVSQEFNMRDFASGSLLRKGFW
jgi:hypothetical protein